MHNGFWFEGRKNGKVTGVRCLVQWLSTKAYASFLNDLHRMD